MQTVMQDGGEIQGDEEDEETREEDEAGLENVEEEEKVDVKEAEKVEEQKQVEGIEETDENSPHFPFDALARDGKDLYFQQNIERIEVPSSLEFYRNYVAANKPVIITNGMQDFSVFFCFFFCNSSILDKY